MHVRAEGVVCMLIPALPLFLSHLRGSRGMSSRKSPYPRNKPEATSDGVTSKRPADAGVSNRNAAHALCDRIFLYRRHHVFVASTLQPRPRRSKRGANQVSAQVIRIVGRQIELRFDLPIRGTRDV
jgi:hypothetical protein